MSRYLALGLLLGLAGCGDSDGDGLSNAEEKKLGTNPDAVDSDGDGLHDGTEVENGTNPALADSDGDGFSDFEEYERGTDPTDPASAYIGGWPVQTADVKDQLEADGNTGSLAEVGKRLPRITMKDQHGDDVDIYDFFGHGKPVFFDISAQWCPPCQATAEWFEGENDLYDKTAPGLVEMVNNGDVYMITVLAENNSYNPANWRTAQQWASDYPNDNIIVLADKTGEMTDWGLSGGYPTMFSLGSDAKVLSYPPADATTLDVIMASAFEGIDNYSE